MKKPEIQPLDHDIYTAGTQQVYSRYFSHVSLIAHDERVNARLQALIISDTCIDIARIANYTKHIMAKDRMMDLFVLLKRWDSCKEIKTYL